MMMTANASAQSQYYNTKHEVGISVGAGAFTEIVSSLADATSIAVSATLTTLVTLGTNTAYYTYGNEKVIPTISAEYYWHVNKVVGWGGLVAFNGSSRDMYVNWHDNVNDTHRMEKSGEATRRNLSLIPMAKIDWLRCRYFGLYSKAGLGVSFMFEHQEDDVEGGTDFTDTTVIPNFQTTLLGIEAGSQRMRAYVEVGIGEQGMALAGLKYKF